MQLGCQLVDLGLRLLEAGDSGDVLLAVRTDLLLLAFLLLRFSFGELQLEPLDGGQARGLRGVLFLLRHDGSFRVARNLCLG